MNKTLLVTIGFILTIIFVISNIYAKSFKLLLCSYRDSACWEDYNLFAIIALLGPTVFVLALFSYMTSSMVFKIWMKSLFVFSLVYVLVVLLTPWDMGNAMAGPSLSKGLVAMGLCILYIVLSVSYFVISKFRN